MAQDGTRGPQEASRAAQEASIVKVFDGFGRSLLFGLPTAQDGPKSPPRSPQDCPRGLKDGSRMAQ
eukprot:468866-Pyramimonas_sp.AAC.1